MKRVILASAALLFTAAQTFAQCAPTSAVYEVLAKRHGEARVVTGITPDGVLVEMWGNPQNGSWTLVATDAQGKTCLLAAGDGLAAFPVGAPA